MYIVSCFLVSFLFLLSLSLSSKVWLDASRGKGLNIEGTFARRNNMIYMDMTFTNRALQPMSDFAIQFNKNRFVPTCSYKLYTDIVIQLNWLLASSSSSSCLLLCSSTSFPYCSLSFGLIPGGVLTVQSPLFPNQSATTSLPVNYGETTIPSLATPPPRIFVCVHVPLFIQSYSDILFSSSFYPVVAASSLPTGFCPNSHLPTCN